MSWSNLWFSNGSNFHLPFNDHVKAVPSMHDTFLSLMIRFLKNFLLKLNEAYQTSSWVMLKASCPAIELRKSFGLRPMFAARLDVETWCMKTINKVVIINLICLIFFLFLRPWVFVGIRPVSIDRRWPN